jgi:hypothetical protein
LLEALRRAAREIRAMTNLYQTSRDSKVLEIEDTAREGFPFRMVITLRKLGAVTMLDYFISPEEAEEITKALRVSSNPVK